MIYLCYDLTSGEIAIVEGVTGKHCLNHGLNGLRRFRGLKQGYVVKQFNLGFGRLAKNTSVDCKDMKIENINFPKSLLDALRDNKLVVFAMGHVSMGESCLSSQFRIC